MAVACEFLPALISTQSIWANNPIVLIQHVQAVPHSQHLPNLHARPQRQTILLRRVRDRFVWIMSMSVDRCTAAACRSPFSNGRRYNIDRDSLDPACTGGTKWPTFTKPPCNSTTTTKPTTTSASTTCKGTICADYINECGQMYGGCLYVIIPLSSYVVFQRLTVLQPRSGMHWWDSLADL